jgi:hypothetical protein
LQIASRRLQILRKEEGAHDETAAAFAEPAETPTARNAARNM